MSIYIEFNMVCSGTFMMFHDWVLWLGCMQRGVDGEQNALHKTNIGQSLRYQLTSQYGGCIVFIPPGHVEIAVNSLWLLHEFARKLGMPKSLVNKFSILYI